MKALLSLVLCGFLFSCSSKDISYKYPDNPDYVRNSRAGQLAKKDVVIYGGKKSEGKSAENNKINSNAKSPLWQASVEVVGALFPVAILDSESGIITSEWYQDSASSNERIKISLVVKGAAAVEENLQVTIFRQKKSAGKGGEWQAIREESSAGGLSARLLRDKILERAR